MFRPIAECFTEPVTDFRRLFNGLEDRYHLPVKISFRDTHAGMIADVVHRAAVIEVLLAGGLLHDLLARDQIAAVSAFDQPAGIGQFVGFVRLATEQHLHAVPRRPIDERLMLAGIPLAFVFQFPDVSAIKKDVVDGASRKLWHRRAELSPFGVQPIHQSVNGERLIREELVHTADILRCGRINFDQAASILADVAIAVRSLAQEPAFLHAACVALTHIDALLIGVERRHRCERSPHHLPGRVTIHRL